MATVLVFYFFFREGGDVEKHRIAGHDMDKAYKDSAGDIAGPMLNWFIWFAGMAWVLV